MPIVMRIDYRHYRQPVVLWTALGMVALALVAVLFGPRINGARRWFGVAGIGVQPSEVAKIAIVFFVAAILERRMDRIDEVRYSLLPIALVVGLVVVLILLQPDLGTAPRILLIVAAMVFAAGINYRYIVGLVLVMLPAALHHSDERRLPSPPHGDLPQPVGGPARRWIPGHSVAHRGRHRRRVRPRAHGRRAEAVLPAVSAKPTSSTR